MPNNIAVSITADAAGLTANRAIASAELKTLQKDLNDLARTAKDGGLTDELRARMLATGDAVAKAKSQVGLIDREIRNLGGGAGEAAKAMGGLHGGSAGVTRELIVMGRELGRGNFTRLSGSATILAQRLGLLTPAVLGVGAAVVAVTAPFIALEVAAEQGQQQLAKFQNTMEATSGYAGVTISELQGMAKGVAAFANAGVGQASKELMDLAASGRLTGDTIKLIGADALKMSELTGEGADKWNAEFLKMDDGVAKFAESYIRHYGQLTTKQFEYIQQLEQQGRKEEAEYAVAKDIYEYLGTQAPEHLGALQKAWRDVGNAVSGYWDSLMAVGRNSNADQIAALEQHRKSFDPSTQAGGEEIAKVDAQIAALKRAEQSEQARAKATAAATAQQKEGADAARKLHEQFEASRASGEKLKAVLRDIDDELKKAVAADPSNKALYEQEAAAARAQAQKADAPKGPKGPGVVEQWQGEFRRAQVLSNDFFGDEAEKELAFWRSKVGLTTQGSKEWLEVQGHIYEASKTQAHQDYQDHLADLNDRLQADKDNWAKEQADWQEKLAYIRSKNGEESSEYKNAHREFEAAEREHQRAMAQIAREDAAEQFNTLKSKLDANKAIRDADAKTAESGVQSGARYNPVLGEVQAAQQIAAIHRQLIAQEIADEETLRAAKMRQLDQDIASYPKGSDEYVKAVKAKEAADQEWADRLRVLGDKAANQQIADQQRIAQAWHSTIDPMVSSVGNQFKGLIEGTESWQQALVRIGEDALGMVISAIERMVEAWIVAQITGAATQRSMASGQVESYASIAGAAGVASMAAAPFPIDLGAPAFGVAMKGAALALGSFAVGTNVVPNDMIAQIHAGERIIPAADNRALMAAVGAGPGGRGRGGDVHQHITYAPQLAGPSKSFRQQLQDHASDVTAMIRTAVRNGALAY